MQHNMAWHPSHCVFYNSPYSQQLAEAANIVEKALPILRVYLHPSHPDLIELQQMKNYCSHSKST